MTMLRKKEILSAAVTGILLLIAVFPAAGQTFDQAISSIASTAAISYTEPAINAFAASINSGSFGRAPAPVKSGFRLEFGMVGMGGYLDKGITKFSTSSSFRLTANEAMSFAGNVTDDPQFAQSIANVLQNQELVLNFGGPTIVGSSVEDLTVKFGPADPEPIRVTHPQYPFAVFVEMPKEEIAIDMGGLLKSVSLIPAAAPQLKIGTWYGTQAVIRYLPKFNIDDEIGDFSFTGFGLQHNLAVWTENGWPVDLTFGFLKQGMSVGEKIKLNSLSYGMHVSRTYGHSRMNFAPFAGILFEDTDIKVYYSETIDTEIGQEKIVLDAKMRAKSKTRFSMGFNLHLLFLNLMFDYTLSDNNSLVGGLSFGL